jgi:hypothetical protein
MVILWSLGFATHKQSLVSSSGGGGNRTSGDSPGSDDSLTVSRTGIPEDTGLEHEENALADVLMTMSQIPDVNLEFAELAAVRRLHLLFRAVKGDADKS